MAPPATGHARVMSNRWFAGAVTTALLAAACGDDESQGTEGPFAVGTRSMEFVDDTRPTPAFGDQPKQPTRTVITDVWYPAEGAADAPAKPEAPAADGPFPLVVFNHGQQGEPQQYAPSFERWARGGYVVAAPRHPLTVRGGPGAQYVHDVDGEIGDIPFVITMMGEELPELADSEHVAVAGHSSGALASLAVGFGECCHDDRVDAVLLEGLPDVSFEGARPARGRGTPLMIIHGTNDAATVEHARAAYDATRPPKFLFLVEGGDHSAMYRDGTQAGQVADAALTFFNYSLMGRERAVRRLQDIPGMHAEPGT